MFNKKPTDDELINAIRAGEDQFRWAINHMHKKWFGATNLNILFLRGSRQDAEEVFHDALMALVRNITEDKYKKQGKTKLKSYFQKIAKNLYLNKKRRDKGISIVEWDDTLYPSPFEEDNKKYYREQLKKYLLKLTEECQKLIHLHSQGYTYDSIAEAVSQSLPTIKRKVPNCKKKLYLLVNPESK